MPFYEGLSGLGLINEKHTTVVIDFGTAYTKVGFAGESGPRAIIRSETQSQHSNKKVTKVFEYTDENELRHNLVSFIKQIYFKHLLVNPKDRRVVIIENLLGPSLLRNTIAKVLFRHYEVLSLLFVPSQLVCLMTLGAPTGLVLDIGYKDSTVIPVYEGVPILHAWQSLPLGSKAIHDSLCALLLDRATCMNNDGSEKRVSAVFDKLPEETLEDITVRTCFVSTLERSSRLGCNKYDRSVEPPAPPSSVEYPLGGSKRLTIPGTIRELATEVLFERDEDDLCIPTMIINAILKCPVDLRRVLAENLMIVGGTANLLGLKHRILSEVRALAASSAYTEKMAIKVFKVHKPPAKDNYVAWLGGAILGSTEAVTLHSLPQEVYLQNNIVPDWSNLAYNVKEDERNEKSA